MIYHHGSGHFHDDNFGNVMEHFYDSTGALSFYTQLLPLFGGPFLARPSAFLSALSFVYSFVGTFICTGGKL